jgi:hypothetical protein
MRCPVLRPFLRYHRVPLQIWRYTEAAPDKADKEVKKTQ